MKIILRKQRPMISRGLALAMSVATFLLLRPAISPATTATWTNTAPGASGNWISGGNWNATAYPGTLAGESAYMTNSVANAYTNILNSTLPNAITTLVVSNANNAGQAWLIVTNNVLQVGTTALNTGGHIQIDAGGVMSNTTAFAWGGANPVLWGGTNGVVHLNGGGKLSTPGLAFQFFVADNFGLVTGTGGQWDMRNTTLYVGIGNAASDRNTLWIEGAGVVLTNILSIQLGANAGCDSNSIVVASGAVLHSGGVLAMGPNVANGNSMIVTNGGQLRTLGATIGAGGTFGNKVIIYGGNPGMASVWNGGGGQISAPSTNALLLIDGAGVVGSAYVTNATLALNSANGGSIVITNGGQMLLISSTSVASNSTMSVGGPGATSTLNIGGGLTWASGATAVDNTWTVKENGVVTNTGGQIVVGQSGAIRNKLEVRDGGKLFTASLYVGNSTAATSNNSVVVSGDGAIYVSASGQLVVGNSANNNSVLVTNGGILEANTIIVNSGSTGNTISNRGGVYQFTTTAPTVTLNGGIAAITDGTISFRSITNADVQSSKGSGPLNTSKLAWSGNNTFMLNAASNLASGASQTYTFDTNLGATNYSRLAMINGNTAYRNGNITIGSGGSMLASNTIGMVDAVVTNLGSIRVVKSTMTWASNVVINGQYVSDPSTNTFLADATVNQSGTLAGGVGDLFDFKKSLLIHSTNQIGFNLANSAVEFSGGGMHTNAITGQDYGTNDLGYAANFAYGELHLGSATDQVCFTCGNIPTVASNGLYIGWLDLLGNANLVTNLHADSTIHLYYDATDTRNAYLGGLTYDLTDCNFVPGGGFLAPVIPEPTSVALLGMASMAFLWKRRRG